MIRRTKRRGWTVLVVPDQGEPRRLRLGPLVLVLGVLFGMGIFLGAIGAPVLLAASIKTNVSLFAERTALQLQKRDLERRLSIEKEHVSSLTRQTKDMSAILADMQIRIAAVEQRAGIPKARRASTSSPRGGEIGTETTDPFAILEMLRRESKNTEAAFTRSLGPLEEQLRRENAVPAGWPAFGPITSKFAVRFGPYTHRVEMHTGWDIAAGFGTPVRATSPGTVVVAGFSNVGYGMHVVIDHGYGYRTLFGHLSQILVNVGDKVDIGSRLGLVGSTGNSTGPHLHYEVRINNTPVNPGPYLSRTRQKAVEN